MTKHHGLGLWMLVLSACATSHGPLPPDGKSNWLTICESDDECGSASTCVCGVCTVTCDVGTECARADAPLAACVDPGRDGIDSSCAASHLGEHAGICLAVCERAGDCRSDQQCVDGACLGGSVATGVAEVPGACANAAGCGPGPFDPGLPTHATATFVGRPQPPSIAEGPSILHPDDVPNPEPSVEAPPGTPSVAETESPDAAVFTAPGSDASVPVETDAGPEPSVEAAPGTPSVAETESPDAAVFTAPGNDASVPVETDAGGAAVTCAIQADFMWADPTVLDTLDDVYGVSAAIDHQGRAIVTWVKHQWNYQTGVTDNFLKFSRHAPGEPWTDAQTLASATGGSWIAGAQLVLNAKGVGFLVWMRKEEQRLMALHYDGTNWAASPTVVSENQLGDWSYPYTGLGVDAAGNAWLVWKPDSSRIFGSRFEAANSQWSAPAVLATGLYQSGQRIDVNAQGDAVLLWQTPTEFWARYYRSGAWSDADSVPRQLEQFAFVLDDTGVGTGWFAEPTGDVMNPYRNRIRRFRAGTGWDDGFTFPESSASVQGHRLAVYDGGTAVAASFDAMGAWNWFEVTAGNTTTTPDALLTTTESAITPGYRPNQWSTLVARGAGRAFAAWGLEWTGAGGGVIAGEVWGRSYCTAVGWGGLEKISGTTGASGLFASAIDDSGRAVAVLGGSTHTLWATQLE